MDLVHQVSPIGIEELVRIHIAHVLLLHLLLISLLVGHLLEWVSIILGRVGALGGGLGQLGLLFVSFFGNLLFALTQNVAILFFCLFWLPL